MKAQGIALSSLLAATACLGLALAPVVTSLPPWIVAAVAAAALLRLALLRLGRQLPPQALRLGLAALAIGLLLLQFHTLNGVAAGTALLSLMAGLKLLETRSNRDLHVILFIVYFMSLAALLRAGSFWLLAYLMLLAWATTASLLRLTDASPGPPWRAALRHSGRIMLQAVPLALVLWLLFPRFNAPLWQLGDDGGATSGLGDTMNPGEISDLALSDEIAFRVRFAGAVPPPDRRYWRGPVLAGFDGANWRRADRDYAPAPSVAPRGPQYRYTVSMEPHRHPWLFVLDLPTQWDLPNAHLTGDYVLVQPEPVAKAIDITATSYTDATMSGILSGPQRDRDSHLPSGANPRTREFALRLRREHPDDRDYAHAALAMIHDEEFYYTLTPPRLGPDPVDEFLFDSRRGFCGHYASAFAVLMREAGIPARVVTGYLGGALNPYGDYWIVRQSDAHAWVEIWIAGGGWMRVDPTAAIAPARVLRAQRSAAASTRVLGMQVSVRLPWLIDAALRLDALREAWRERVLRFDQNSQHHLLQRLLIPEPDSGKLVLVLAGALSLVFGWLTWHVRRELLGAPGDDLGRSYAKLCAKLRKAGLGRFPHEGAEALAERIAAARPDLAANLRRLARQYTDLRYGARGAAPGEIALFRSAVRAFDPRASG